MIYAVSAEPDAAWIPSGAKRISPPRLATRALFRAAGADAGRRVQARLSLRRTWDRMVRLPDDATRVYASSLGARRVLAEARRRGIEGILVEDLPDLRRLHKDLDQAARLHPECGLLRRFRAPPGVLARQEIERVLASRRLTDRPGEGDAIQWPAPPSTSPRRGPRVLLSGLPVARNGTIELLCAVEGLDLTVVARRGEIVEPAGARLTLVDPAGLADLDGIGLVVAPALVEGRHPALAQAALAGIPTIATAVAAGRVQVTREVPVSDAIALREAICALT